MCTEIVHKSRRSPSDNAATAQIEGIARFCEIEITPGQIEMYISLRNGDPPIWVSDQEVVARVLTATGAVDEVAAVTEKYPNIFPRQVAK